MYDEQRLLQAADVPSSAGFGDEIREADHSIIGAGPAGLVAAATLARHGRRVGVYEKADVVGHRFAGDFQGLENWSSTTDAMDRLRILGVAPGFDHRPFNEVTFYDSDLQPVLARSSEPIFYLLRRGPQKGSLDRALLEQAREAGADVRLGQAADRAGRGDIIAIGPRYADGIATGYVFATSLEDQAHCIVSNDLAPGGYSYLLIWEGRATLATCLFRETDRSREVLHATVEAFTGLVPGIDLDGARPFRGFGSLFGRPRFSDEAGRLFIGEAAGLQDPEWGFGMWHAMESGALAARSLLEGFDYTAAARAQFEGPRNTALFNRIVHEHSPDAAVRWLIRRGASSTDIRRRIRRHWKSNPIKNILARAALPRFNRDRLHHRDRACHQPTCDCVWCTHGDPRLERSSETIFANPAECSAVGGSR